jgi:hypothetical protein
VALLNQTISWSEAWQLKSFRNKTFVALVLVAIILLLLPYFFAFIEKREGMVLQDFVLERLPAMDVSIPTFVIIWSVVLLVFYRIYQNPSIFLVVAYGFILMCIARVLTISLLPLNPPPGLITLKDPIANIAYGGKGIFITKDLFYSGHRGKMGQNHCFSRLFYGGYPSYGTTHSLQCRCDCRLYFYVFYLFRS